MRNLFGSCSLEDLFIYLNGHLSICSNTSKTSIVESFCWVHEAAEKFQEQKLMYTLVPRVVGHYTISSSDTYAKAKHHFLLCSAFCQTWHYLTSSKTHGASASQDPNTCPGPSACSLAHIYDQNFLEEKKKLYNWIKSNLRGSKSRYSD